MNSKLYKMVRSFIILFIGTTNLVFFQNCQNYSGQISSASLDKISPTQDPNISTPDSQIPVSTDPGTGSTPGGGVTNNNDPTNNTNNPIIQIDDHVTPCTPGATCPPDSIMVNTGTPGGTNGGNPSGTTAINGTTQVNNGPGSTDPNNGGAKQDQGSDPGVVVAVIDLDKKPPTEDTQISIEEDKKKDESSNEDHKKEDTVAHNDGSDKDHDKNDDHGKCDDHADHHDRNVNHIDHVASHKEICDPNSLGLKNLKENKILNLTMEDNNNFDLTIPNGIKLVRYQGAEPLHIRNVAHQSDTQICGNIIIDQLSAHGGFVITNVQITKLNLTGNITSQKFDGDFLVPVGSKVSGNKKCQVNENYEIINCEDLYKPKK